jgi:alpha-L-rhamnosidase
MQVIKLRCEYRENPVGIDALLPRFSWILLSKRRNIIQTAYQLQVFADPDFKQICWDTGQTVSDRSVQVEYQGPSLHSRRRYYWRVRVWDNHGGESEWSQTAFWEMGVLSEKEWVADFITPTVEDDPSKPAPCPMLRKEFEVTGSIASGRIYATALGLYELRLNGIRVGEELFTPGWTSYQKRLQYQTYDITTLLQPGKNALGAILGDGWYKGYVGWENKRNYYGDKPAFFLQLHIGYADGTEQVITTDGTWKTSTGPIRMSEIYHGETYDAGLEKVGWDCPGIDNREWAAVKTVDIPKKILVAQENVPVKKIEEIKPVNIFRTPAGETVIDMGQNMVGWVRFRVKGPKGTKVVLKHAEVLDKEENFYIANLRAARQTIEYILKGEGEESFEPHFTFQGFRYVKVEEYPGEPSLEDFTGIVIHSALEPSGRFECSNALINQLQHNILWGLKGNFVDVPTDCPQRNERLGWTGDAQVFIRTACFNMNTVSFFEKWLRDLQADQLENGGVPFVIPDVLRGDIAVDQKKAESHSSSGWGDAAVICPWTVYLCYGDERILADRYDSMKAWVEYIRSRAENGMIWNAGFHFGDWVALDASEGSYFGATSTDLIATAFYAYSTGILAKTAKILGKEEDARDYTRLYQNVVTAFRKEFFTPAGRLAVPTQTAHVLALCFDLVAEGDRKRTVDTLARYIEENGVHLTTGFLGTPYLCHALSRNGHFDLAYRLLMQTDYPSWLYQVTKGATTIWEHWDGIKPDGSFWSPDMNSFNHYAYGAIGDWLYRAVAGIEIDEAKPGYKHILVQPQPGGSLEFAQAELESVYGTVRSGWRVERGGIRVEVAIPANTTATVALSGAKADRLTVDGKPLKEQEIILDYSENSAGVTVELGSGEYVFWYGKN